MAAKERLVVLDVLRGFALFGVLIVNLPFAALPSEWALAPVEGAASPLRELVPWAIVKAFGETKLVSIFSLLFGIGLVLQIGRAEARGSSTTFYLRRLGILAVIGLLHGLLLWFGDILLPYAIAGFVLYLLRHQSPRRLVALAIPLFLVGILLSAGVTVLDPGASAGGGEKLSLLGFKGTWGELEARAWQDGLWQLTFTVRAIEYVAWLFISSLISFNWHVMALFLLGAALMKQGALERRHRRRHGQLAVVGWIVGLVLEGVAISWWLVSDFAPGLAGLAPTLLHEVGSLVLAAGYVGTVAWMVHGGLGKWLYPPLAAVGRTALSCYLGQSVAFNLLFPWYGLGLWGELDRLQLLILGCGLFALQAVLAMLWLHRFTMGPLEWLWRWATYGVRPPLRKGDASNGGAGSPARSETADSPAPI